ncbi:MAG: HAD family hydrolase [Bacteroidales bacterium]|nr:HAD family hydrolase [Bacteroidales bacterium]
MIKLVIFDLDGTLLNTIEDLGNAVNYALSECGYPIVEMGRYNNLVGRGIMNLFRGALPENARDEQTVLKMKEHFLKYYTEHNKDCTRPYDGILPMLDMLKDNGVKLAVASNKYQKGTEDLINCFFGDYEFVSILGQREGFPIKPSPEIVNEVLKASKGISKEETVYIGDSNVDMETGINADVRTIGALWGFRTKEELAAYNPWHLSESPIELKEFLENNL